MGSARAGTNPFARSSIATSPGAKGANRRTGFARRSLGLFMLAALTRKLTALPAPHQQVEDAGMQIGARHAPRLALLQIADMKNLGPARRHRQKLHLAGPL